MEFDKSRVYTALNADELKIGSNVIVADNIETLRLKVEENIEPDILDEVNPDDYSFRFDIAGVDYMLAYLVYEPRGRRIEELERTCQYLSDKFDYQVKQVMKLEKENGKLKVQLTKAKEIIKALLKHTHGQNLNTQNDFDLYLDRIKDAEQFLKED